MHHTNHIADCLSVAQTKHADMWLSKGMHEQLIQRTRAEVYMAAMCYAHATHAMLPSMYPVLCMHDLRTCMSFTRTCMSRMKCPSHMKCMSFTRTCMSHMKCMSFIRTCMSHMKCMSFTRTCMSHTRCMSHPLLDNSSQAFHKGLNSSMLAA